MTGKHEAVIDRPRFIGDGPRAQALDLHREEVLRLIGSYGGREVHVFGSVARGAERSGSDIDLVFVADRPLTLLAMLCLNRALRDLLGFTVDLFCAQELRDHVLDRIAVEAVPL